MPSCAALRAPHSFFFRNKKNHGSQQPAPTKCNTRRSEVAEHQSLRTPPFSLPFFPLYHSCLTASKTTADSTPEKGEV